MFIRVFVILLAIVGGVAISDAMEGGSKAQAGDWRQVVGIETDTEACSAVFLSNNILITAAHCMRKDDGSAFTGELTVYLLSEDWNAHDFPISSTTLHPGFSIDNDSMEITMSGIDIAVVILRDPQAMTKVGASVAQINSSESFLQGLIGTNVTDVALGTDARDEDQPKRYLTAQLSQVLAEHVIELSLTKDQGTLCEGDSGGAVFHVGSNQTPILLGLNSGVLNSCGSGAQKSSAIDIAPQACWIQQTSGLNLGASCH